jgi:hypothetical protein
MRGRATVRDLSVFAGWFASPNDEFRRGREPGPSDDPTAGKPLARSGAAEVSRDRLPPVPFAPLEKLPAIGAFVRARPLA